MKDAHCAESNEKSIFPFFEIFLGYGDLFTIYGDTPAFSSVSPNKKKSLKSGRIYSSNSGLFTFIDFLIRRDKIKSLLFGSYFEIH